MISDVDHLMATSVGAAQSRCRPISPYIPLAVWHWRLRIGNCLGCRLNVALLGSAMLLYAREVESLILGEAVAAVAKAMAREYSGERQLRPLKSGKLINALR